MDQTVSSPDVRRRARRWQLAVLVTAPAVALAARLLATPWYQDDADRPDHARLLDEVAASSTAHDVGALLTFVSALLYASAAVAVGSMVRPRTPRLVTAGTLLGVVGGFGLAVFADQQALVGRAAELTEHRAAMVALLDASHEAPQSGVAYLLLLLGALGWLLLGAALNRSGQVPTRCAVLVGLGGAAVMGTAPGPLTSFIAGAAVVSLVGLWWTASTCRS